MEERPCRCCQPYAVAVISVLRSALADGSSTVCVVRVIVFRPAIECFLYSKKLVDLLGIGVCFSVFLIFFGVYALVVVVFRRTKSYFGVCSKHVHGVFPVTVDFQHRTTVCILP